MRLYVDSNRKSSRKKDDGGNGFIIILAILWVFLMEVWSYSPILAKILIVIIVAFFVLVIIALLFGTNNSDNLSLNLNEIDQMTGYEFERYIATLYGKMGYFVQQTALSGDQGADIVLAKNGERIAVQTKRYANKVSNKAIQEVVASKALYGCDRCMVVTNNYFTKSAIELATVNYVKLVDRMQLQNLIYNATNQLYTASTVNEQDSVLKQRNFYNYLDTKDKQDLNKDNENPPLPFYMKQSIQAKNKKNEGHLNKVIQKEYLEDLNEDDENPPLPIYMKQSIQAKNKTNEGHLNKVIQKEYFEDLNEDDENLPLPFYMKI
jgi:HJR/Mrr/RecB family endonuclease